eukprot:gene1471-1855_t
MIINKFIPKQNQVNKIIISLQSLSIFGEGCSKLNNNNNNNNTRNHYSSSANAHLLYKSVNDNSNENEGNLKIAHCVSCKCTPSSTTPPLNQFQVQQQQQQQQQKIIVPTPPLPPPPINNTTAAAAATTNTTTTTTPTTTKPQVSFYKRNLPSHLVEFSSEEGRKLFRDALQQGYMEGYFALAEQFVSQSDPAYCGLATLAMILNSLKIDPKRLWKGPWRWFAEDMLDCCTPIESVKKRGITFTEFACLSRCNGANIRQFRGDEVDIDQFRESIKEACSGDGTHLVISYSRKVLGQTGSGHYSPIGGYHEGRDLALVLDVARFKYSPHWVPVEVLWESMRAIDKDTNRPRGYYLMSRDPSYQPSFCRVKNTLSWASIADQFMNGLPSILEQAQPQTVEQVIETVFQSLPQETPLVLCAYSHELHRRLTNPLAASLVSVQNEDSKFPYLKQTTKFERMNWESFFKEIQNSQAYQLINPMINGGRIKWKISHRHDLSLQPSESCHDFPNELAALMYLSFPSQIYNRLSSSLRDQLSILRNLDGLDPEVISEIMKIREEMFLVNQSPCQCSPSEKTGCNGTTTTTTSSTQQQKN